MSNVPAVLLLDDGELNSVAELLERSNIEYRRVRGSEMEREISPPSNLLISTPRHASKVRRGSPPGSLPGRPVRIIATNEDSPSMRRMLRQMGFNLLIRQPAHPEVLGTALVAFKPCGGIVKQLKNAKVPFREGIDEINEYVLKGLSGWLWQRSVEHRVAQSTPLVLLVIANRGLAGLHDRVDETIILAELLDLEAALLLELAKPFADLLHPLLPAPF